ncbi:MAG: hypothetical protein RXR20_27080 [Paraburkholderia sp.]|jgi:hypothetical protein|uniref:hypothetical protein n=1 Tax=Paraburkholderia sp. TaxID=1926495 RepID=UPI00397812A1
MSCRSLYEVSTRLWRNAFYLRLLKVTFSRFHIDFARDASGLVTRIDAVMSQWHRKDAICVVEKADSPGHNAYEFVVAIGHFILHRRQGMFCKHHAQDRVTGSQRGDVFGSEAQANEVAIFSHR